jgi:hypothetical protein
VLVVVAAGLPWLLARGLGRRPWALVLNAALSALLLMALGAGYFLALYAVQDPRVLALARAEPASAVRHFAGLGAMAGLIWAPVLLVSLLSLPRR